MSIKDDLLISADLSNLYWVLGELAEKAKEDDDLIKVLLQLEQFVETHKIPISQKLNWYLDTRKRPAAKALPKWMLKMLRFNRVKD